MWSLLTYRRLAISLLMGVLVSNLFAMPYGTRLYYGTVHEKTEDGSWGPNVPGVEVLFRERRSGIDVKVLTDHNGYYRARLPQADYEVVTVLPSYVIRKRDWWSRERKFETFTYKVEEPLLRSDPYQGNRTVIDYVPLPIKEVDKKPLKPLDSAPIIELEISKDTVLVGEEFTITVRAHDMDGLSRIWWYSTFSKSKELSKKHEYICKGQSVADHSWKVSISKPGLNVFAADAIDVEYDPDDTKTAHKASMIYQIPELKVLAIESRN